MELHHLTEYPSTQSRLYFLTSPCHQGSFAFRQIFVSSWISSCQSITTMPAIRRVQPSILVAPTCVLLVRDADLKLLDLKLVQVWRLQARASVNELRKCGGGSTVTRASRSKPYRIAQAVLDGTSLSARTNPYDPVQRTSANSGGSTLVGRCRWAWCGLVPSWRSGRGGGIITTHHRRITASHPPGAFTLRFGRPRGSR
jgi:hypothetical protein